MSARLILVTGLPCAGKSTLAAALGARLGFPVFTKDQLKETLLDRLGAEDRAGSKRLSLAAFDLLHGIAATELAAGRSLILEGNFDPAREGPRYQELAARTGAATAQVVLWADGEVLVRRFRERHERGERHPGHLDAEALPELEASLRRGRLEPLLLSGPVLEVDTTDFAAVDLEDLLGRLSR